MQNFHLLEYSAEAFQCHVHHFQCLTVPVELTDEVCFPVHGGWDSRAVSVTGMCERVYEFCNVIDHLVSCWVLFVYLVLFGDKTLKMVLLRPKSF